MTPGSKGDALGARLDLGRMQDRCSAASLAVLEEEAAPRWRFGSPKATPDMSRRIRDDNAARREMEMLEEKMMRQVLRLQEQSERFMDIMMHPLEAKVAALEGRQPVLDCNIAELRGNLKGLQDSMEMQVRRNDQTETRMCKWRKTLEDELQSRVGEVSNRLEEGPSPADTVSRGELVELAKVLKQELKKLVEEAFREGQAVPRQELSSMSTTLREELSHVEKVAADAAAQKLHGHEELASAAEAVRMEMKSLTEKAIQEEALVRASLHTVQDLEKASDQTKKALAILEKRLAKCEKDTEPKDSQLEAVEEERQSLQAGLVATEMQDMVAKEVALRIEALEAFQQELAEEQKKLSSEVAQRSQDAAVASQDQLAQPADAKAAQQARELLNESLSRMGQCEEQLQELRDSFKAAQARMSLPEQPARAEDQDLSDVQLMLLDLQHRVMLLEGDGETSLEARSSGPLGHAAELIQKIEMDLQHAREAVHCPGSELQLRDEAYDILGEPGASEASAEVPASTVQLPPLAAMKVMESPKLQRLSMPRSQLGAAMPPSDLGAQLRAEVAAVWDAVGELAELIDADPGSLSTLQHTASAASAKADVCQSSIELFAQQLQSAEAALQQLGSRVFGCEQKLAKELKAETSPPSRISRAFDLPRAESNETLSDVAGESKDTTRHQLPG